MSDRAKLLAQALAEELLSLKGGGGLGPQPGSPAAAQRVWPAGTGAAPPGMLGESQPVGFPGFALEKSLLHPSISVYENMDRVLPEEGWFTANVGPARPVQFELLGFAVPQGMALWITDYEFSVYVPSGLDPGDAVPAEPGRFSQTMGFDINFGGTRPASNIRYGLDARPSSVEKSSLQSFTVQSGRSAQAFALAAASSFGAATGAGLSLQPVWDKVMGPRQGPFTLIAKENTRVALDVAIFRRILSPLAFIQARVAGYHVPENVSHAILNRARLR